MPRPVEPRAWERIWLYELIGTFGGLARRVRDVLYSEGWSPAKSLFTWKRGFCMRSNRDLRQRWQFSSVGNTINRWLIDMSVCLGLECNPRLPPHERHDLCKASFNMTTELLKESRQRDSNQRQAGRRRIHQDVNAYIMQRWELLILPQTAWISFMNLRSAANDILMTVLVKPIALDQR